MWILVGVCACLSHSYNYITYSTCAKLSIDVERAFIRRFVRAFAPSLDESNDDATDILEEFENDLINNLYITGDTADFNTAVYIQNIIDGVISITIDTLFAPRAAGNLTVANRMCITGELVSRINTTVRDRIAGNLEELRRAVTSVRRIRMFYSEYIANLTTLSSRIIGGCANAFINLRCAGCTSDIEETCRGTCFTVLRACFSPYYSQLTGQLNVLWNVTNQLVNIANRLTLTLGKEPDQLLTFNRSDPVAVTIVVSIQCPT